MTKLDRNLASSKNKEDILYICATYLYRGTINIYNITVDEFLNFYSVKGIVKLFLPVIICTVHMK